MRRQTPLVRRVWPTLATTICLVLALATPALAQSSSLTLAWDAPPQSVVGYSVYWGTSSGRYTSSQTVGSVTEFTATNLMPGTRYYFAVQSIAGDGLRSDYSAEVSGIAPEPTSGVALPEPGTVAFSRSGTMDLLWQHETTGWLAASQLRGLTLSKPGLIIPGQVPDTDWKIVTAVDLNRDGQRDLIWRHRTAGWVAYWPMRGSQRISSEMLHPDRVLDLDWQICGAGDFDGDGWTDLVWHHARVGFVAVWLMRGANVRKVVVLSTSVPDTDWHLVGAGDLDRDKRPDLIWRHVRTGAVAAWFMDHLKVRKSGLIGPGYVPLYWRVAAVTDANKDGYADLIWQKDDGWLGLWFMKGAKVQSSYTLGAQPSTDSAWHVVGPR